MQGGEAICSARPVGRFDAKTELLAVSDEVAVLVRNSVDFRMAILPFSCLPSDQDPFLANAVFLIHKDKLRAKVTGACFDPRNSCRLFWLECSTGRPPLLSLLIASRADFSTSVERRECGELRELRANCVVHRMEWVHSPPSQTPAGSSHHLMLYFVKGPTSHVLLLSLSLSDSLLPSHSLLCIDHLSSLDPRLPSALSDNFFLSGDSYGMAIYRMQQPRPVAIDIIDQGVTSGVCAKRFVIYAQLQGRITQRVEKQLVVRDLVSGSESPFLLRSLGYSSKSTHSVLDATSLAESPNGRILLKIDRILLLGRSGRSVASLSELAGWRSWSLLSDALREHLIKRRVFSSRLFSTALIEEPEVMAEPTTSHLTQPPPKRKRK